MNLYCGIEYEDYKYVYGVRMTNRVPFDQDKEIKQVICKNDWSAVQVLMYSDEDMLVGISDETSLYYGGDIDQVRVDIEVDSELECSLTTKLVGLIKDDDGQFKSDILLDTSTNHVVAKKVQPIWIQIDTNEATKPGKYNVRVCFYHKRMFKSEELIKELEYQIEVLDYELKKPCDYDFYLDLWQHNCNIARKYDVPVWSDSHFQILSHYVASLAGLGQKAISIIVSDVPWSGQGCAQNKMQAADLYEYNMAKLSYSKAKGWCFDFTTLERYIKLCISHGIDEEIEVFGLSNIWLLEDFGFGKLIKDYPDGIKLRYFDDDNKLYKYVTEKSVLIEYIKALEAFFIEKGWIDKVRIVADEPADTESFLKKVSDLNSIAPSFKLKVATLHADILKENVPCITDYCPSLECLTTNHETFSSMRDQIKGRLSYYVCCGPSFPNTFINSPLVESRLIPWLAWYMGVDGFLRWNYTVWPEDPINNLAYLYPVWPAGDTNFVYPGKSSKPVLSLRYMSLKRGIRDFQIISDLVDKCGNDDDIKCKMREVIYQEAFLLDNIDREKLYSLDALKYEDIITRLLESLICE